MDNLFIGTSGFVYDSWIGDFYPADLPKTRLLEYYAHTFNSIEVNSTFYITPKRQTIDKWVKTTGNRFVFTFKASRFITHIKRLKITGNSLEKFFTPLKVMAKRGRKHCILYQVPANFRKDIQRLENFLKKIPSGFHHAFEFRHLTWFDEEVFHLMKKYKAAIVLNDSPRIGKARKWPLLNTSTATFLYIRFHGSKKVYTSQYTDAELKYYASIMKERLTKGHAVYAYFNNDSKGYAPHDALRLRNYLEKIMH
jgi:uncharacterized protein YecE (DUF72 family)